jgi:hypothetical protein
MRWLYLLVIVLRSAYVRADGNGTADDPPPKSSTCNDGGSQARFIVAMILSAIFVLVCAGNIVLECIRCIRFHYCAPRHSFEPSTVSAPAFAGTAVTAGTAELPMPSDVAAASAAIV